MSTHPSFEKYPIFNAKRKLLTDADKRVMATQDAAMQIVVAASM